MDKSTEIVQISFRSTFFFKDSLEWNRFYKILSNIEKVDKIKLLYLAMLSLETLLKAIVLLQLPIEMEDMWIKDYLRKELNHWLFDAYKKIQWFILTKDQEELLRQRDSYGVEIRYSTDALLEKWLEIKWLQSNKNISERKKKNKRINTELSLYEQLYASLLIGYRNQLNHLDWKNWNIFFDAMVSEKYSLWVSNFHHKFYKNKYNLHKSKTK